MTLAEQVAQLKAENEALKARNAHRAPGLSFKVSEKGGVSVYGLGRFPVTLYREQWERLLAPEQVEALRAFIVAHVDQLKTKGE
jgi:hypothetical protein